MRQSFLLYILKFYWPNVLTKLTFWQNDFDLIRSFSFVKLKKCFANCWRLVVDGIFSDQLEKILQYFKRYFKKYFKNILKIL